MVQRLEARPCKELVIMPCVNLPTGPPSLQCPQALSTSPYCIRNRLLSMANLCAGHCRPYSCQTNREPRSRLDHVSCSPHARQLCAETLEGAIGKG